MSAAPEPGPEPRMEGRPAHRRLAAILLALCALTLALQPLAGFDTWWHLASGREMERRGELLREDPFTFGAGDGPWLDHEWLWQLGAWKVFRLAAPAVASTPVPLEAEERGASALTVINGLLLAAAFVLGSLAVSRAGAGGVLAFAVPLLCAWGASPRFLARPESATLLLLAIALALLARAQGHAARTACLLAALGALGANLHPGVLAIAAVCGLFLAGRFFDAVAARIGRREDGSAGPAAAALSGAVILGAALAGTALNPAGVRLWKVPFDLSAIVRTGGWHNPEWLPSTPSNAPLLFAAFATAAGIVLLAWMRARTVEFATLLPAFALAALAVSGYRHIGLFFVALPFALARPLAGLLPLAARRPRGTRSGLPSLLASSAAALALLAFFRPPALGIDRTTTPVDAVHFLEEAGVSGRLYDDVRFGGYLDWRFPEGRRVLLDGRNELFVPLMTELAGIYSGTVPWQAWQAFVDRNRIEGAVVRYLEQKKGVTYPSAPGAPPTTGYRAYSAYLFPPDRWSLVYWDDTAMVFLRRGGSNDRVIREQGYDLISPEDAAYQLERAASDPSFRTALEKDVARRMSALPKSSRAREIDAELREMPR